MATNTDTGWILNQVMFQNAIEGEDVRNRLITCLDMMEKSHNLRVNNAIKGKVTTYKFNNNFDPKEKRYELHIKTIAIYNDGVEDFPLEGEKVLYYGSGEAKKSEPYNMNDRMMIYYNANKWNIELLVASDDYPKGYKISFPRNQYSFPNEFETTFPAF